MSHTANELAAAEAILASAKAEEWEARMKLLETQSQVQVNILKNQELLLAQSILQTKALNRIADVLAGFNMNAVTFRVGEVSQTTAQAAVEEPVEEETFVKVEEPAKPEPVKMDAADIQEKVEAAKAEKAADPAPAPAEERKITADDIRQALRSISMLHGKPTAIELLAKYEATDVSSLKKEKYEAFMADAEKLTDDNG